mmetsp:Transcript_9361/g.25490  ORF Transcript_9361/g.25490 Transcript_9361/m.25490 type:complete len:214 (-) Transcript_9361:90-731(-)
MGSCMSASSSPTVVSDVPNPTVKFETTMGTFEAELYLGELPMTVSSFIDLVQKNFYDGIHFHRVIKNFMLQFGCPYAKDHESPQAGTGGPAPRSTYKNLVTGAEVKRDGGGNIRDEHTSKRSNEPGTLSMANTGAANSGGSQFFVNTVHNDFLDWFSPGDSKHPVFGKVTSGMDVVQAIEGVSTNSSDRPREPVKMISVTVSNLPAPQAEETR